MCGCGNGWPADGAILTRVSPDGYIQMDYRDYRQMVDDYLKLKADRDKHEVKSTKLERELKESENMVKLQDAKIEDLERHLMRVSDESAERLAAIKAAQSTGRIPGWFYTRAS